MAERLPSFLPRLAVLVLVALGLSAGLTFAAGQQITSSAPPAAPTAPRRAETVVVPDVRHLAFVFAKQQLADSNFAWRIAGSVGGFASNTVVAQSPAPGTKLIETGSPPITLTLARNPGYKETGDAQDTSPYPATPLKLVGVTAPKLTSKPKPAAKPAAKPAVKPAPPSAAKPAAATPASRPPDFVVPGARKEPLDEIPLTVRAAKLGTWLAAHPKPTNANVKYWLYQNAWIVDGARMGWWHGAQALRSLIAVDTRAQSVWGIGAKSEILARRALAEVEARQ